MLAQADAATFINMEPEDVHALFVWGLGGQEKYRLPSLMMPLKAFMEWTVTVHEQFGERLANRQWGK
eukprot:5851228-Lingulodinium_polyedra.AAC.1